MKRKCIKSKHKKLSVIEQYRDNCIKQDRIKCDYGRAHSYMSDGVVYDMPDGIVDDITYLQNLRVPRLKASRAAWKRFYKTFPWTRGAKTVQKMFSMPRMNMRTDLYHGTIQHLKLKQLD